MILHQQTANDNLKVSRTDKNEVYQVIIQDLQNASDYLPQRYTGEDIGRATSGAALGLLAKVYLTLKQYNDVIDVIERLMATNVYSLNGKL